MEDQVCPHQGSCLGGGSGCGVVSGARKTANVLEEGRRRPLERLKNTEI